MTLITYKKNGGQASKSFGYKIKNTQSYIINVYLKIYRYTFNLMKMIYKQNTR